MYNKAFLEQASAFISNLNFCHSQNTAYVLAILTDKKFQASATLFHALITVHALFLPMNVHLLLLSNGLLFIPKTQFKYHFLWAPPYKSHQIPQAKVITHSTVPLLYLYNCLQHGDFNIFSVFSVFVLCAI